MIRIGLDIGGTKTAALVAGPNGRELGQAQTATDVADPSAVVDSASEAITAALTDAEQSLADVAAVGVGVPGQVNPIAGTVQLAVNLGITEPFRLADALQVRLGVPVVLENDVRVAALGAYEWARQQRPIGSLAYISIGTGIASGLVFNGQLFRGAAGMAGEIGHIPLDVNGPLCACGTRGCLEVLAAGPAIASRYAELYPGDLTAPVSAADVFRRATAGESLARTVIARAGHYLARAVYMLAMTVDVEQIVIGGGVAGAGESFSGPLRNGLDWLRADSSLAAMMIPAGKVVILPPDYSAGLWGALRLAQELAQSPVRSTTSRTEGII